MAPIRLSRFGELALLKEIRRNFPNRSADVLVGIGDDAAVLRSGRNYLLATTDMMVESVHFDLRLITASQLGFKLVSVNVSDIYAMGGEPRCLLLNVAVPGHTTREFIDSFLDGVKGALDLYRVELIGGDISSARKEMCVSATLIGYARRYIRRCGARVGDVIYVTGALGDSACGLELLKRFKSRVPLEPAQRFKKKRRKSGVSAVGLRSPASRALSPEMMEPLLRRHLLPEARKPGSMRSLTSMIDISDGLLIDLSRLCDESRVGARIYEEKVPVSPELKAAAQYLRKSPLKMALTGGEDYELLFTAPGSDKVNGFAIGEIIRSGRVIVDRKGREKPFSPQGYRHFG